MSDLIERITKGVWSEVADSRQNKWLFRREHVENAVRKAFAAAPDLARALIDTTAERDALQDQAWRYTDEIDGFVIENHALRERVARLEAALQPFAEEAEGWADFNDCQELVEPWAEGPEDLRLTVKHLRAARAALQEDTHNDL